MCLSSKHVTLAFLAIVFLIVASLARPRRPPVAEGKANQRSRALPAKRQLRQPSSPLRRVRSKSALTAFQLTPTSSQTPNGDDI